MQMLTFVRTGVTPTSNFEIYLDGMLTNADGNWSILGTSNGSIIIGKAGASLFTSGINGNWSNGGIRIPGLNNRFWIGLSPHWILQYDGSYKYPERPYTPSGTLTLFASTSSYVKASARIYGVKLYDGNTLTFDGIPASRDGVLGIYDKVSKTFFANAGTGTFIAGPVVDNVYLPENQQ